MNFQLRGSLLSLRFARALLYASVGILATTRGAAQMSGEPAQEHRGGHETAAARSALVIGVSGPLDAGVRRTLVQLLRADLEPRGIELVERDPSDEPRAWARAVAEDERHLLAALLETEDPAGWRLVLIDTARGRAISRELPGGERDSANVEAIVSIVRSAANALREGLEVASAPIETVIEGPLPAPSKSASPERPPEPRPQRAGTALHTSLAAVVTSFASDAEPMLGASLGIGVSIASAFDLDLGAARFLPASVTDDFGTFSLERTTLSFTAGPSLRLGALALVPAGGVVGEWIVREDTRAAPGVALGEEPQTVQRWGGVLTLRGRYPLLSSKKNELLSLTAALGGAYFGESIRFLAGTDTMTEARRSMVGAEFGLFLTTDPL